MIGYIQGKSSKDHADILNFIDFLRSRGLQSDLSLPQIIVCGAQSCGKSSVLEAISGIEFPVHDGLCTRFPSELVIRRQAETSVKVAIIPSAECSESEKCRLESFSYDLTVESFPKRFKDIINDAKNVMGIDATHLFSSNILRIEISGPEQQPLTLVDLPGLYSSANTSQPAEGMSTVRNINEEYMKNPRSIIIAVVMASNEHVNQEVTQLARKYDPTGLRTMGLITKPDTLAESSPSQDRFIKLAKNEDIRFALGWHVLKNRDWGARETSLDERNAKEKEFFAQEPWSSLDSSMLGIESLQTRLNYMLRRQITEQLPGLERDIKGKLEKISEDLNKLGVARDTPSARRAYLRSAAKQFERLVRDACDGNYNSDNFFGNSKTYAKTRLIMVIRKAMDEFSNNIKVNCMKFNIVEDEDLQNDDGNGKNGAKICMPEVSADKTRSGRWHKPGQGADEAALAGKRAHKKNTVSRSEFIKYVKEVSSNNMGRELPGQFPLTIITTLFKEQSRDWGTLTDEFLEKVMHLARGHVTHVLGTIFTPETSGVVMTEIINEKMEQIRQTMRAKAKEQLKGHTGIPFTQDERFYNKVKQQSSDRRRKLIRQCIVKDYSFTRSGTENGLGRITLSADAIDAMVRTVDEALTKDSSESEAVDYLLVYYKTAAERYVDTFFLNVINNCLLEALPELYDSETVIELDDNKVTMLADDTLENKKQRKMLDERKDGLESALSKLRPLMDKLHVEAAMISVEEPRVMFHQPDQPDAGSRVLSTNSRSNIGDEDSSVLSSNASTTRAAFIEAIQKAESKNHPEAKQPVQTRAQEQDTKSVYTGRWVGGMTNKEAMFERYSFESDDDEDKSSDSNGSYYNEKLDYDYGYDE